MPGYPRPQSVRPVALVDLAAALGVPVLGVPVLGVPVLGVAVSPAGPVPAAGRADPVAVTGVTNASDAVHPGDLFAALPGARTHGARFVAAAVAAGAVAVLTDPAGADAAATAGVPALVVPDPRAVLGEVAATVYDRPTEKLTVIGITGTAGKTSTAYLIEAGLRAAGHTVGLVGTVETRLGDLVVDSARTTPEACDLQGLFAAALQRGVTAVVIEVSSHALVLDRVTGTAFTVGGYTNFGTDHLDFHATRAEYFDAKARLFDGRCQHEVINYDDLALRPLIHAGTVTYSALGAVPEPGATGARHWRAADVTSAGYGQRFTALAPDGTRVDAAVGLPGRHNLANALLALACLTLVGVDPAVAAIGVAGCPGVPGRMERVDAPGPVTGIVDYAHKPDAIVAVLVALREAATGQVIAVLGAGGDRDHGKRPVMGAAAARGADLVLVTDDNPRTEVPAEIRAQVLAGARDAGTAEVVEVAGRRDAIAEAVRRAGPGDLIALLGKGHERGQEIAGQVYPFDDRVELARALAQRFGAPADPGADLGTNPGVDLGTNPGADLAGGGPA